MKKNFLKILLTAFAILAISNGLLAQSFVDESFAKQIGSNFISQKSRNEKSQLNMIHTEKGADGQPNLYIYNVEGGGFVIVSASRNMRPILAYSVNHSYVGEIPEPAWYFINNYSKNIDFCDENNVSMEIADAEWMALENNELPAVRNAKTVDPMIQTLWNQDYPYNYYAPETSGGWWGGGPGGHCYAGCVACAMSQIMKYWNHPVQGHGSHSYTHSTYGVQSADFGATTYNWAIMPNELGYQADDPAKAVALLMYHCGVSVDMNFGPDGSGAQSKAVENAMRQYFGYGGALYLERSKFESEAEWIALLKSELDKSQPMYFSGSSDSGSGHAIVCDGYDANDYFSFNLGWSGSGNDYYSINDVAGFHNNEAIVMNIVPLEINADENNIIYVSADGTGDGSSWANATQYLEYASARSIDGINKVWVKTGTYYGDLSNLNGAFLIYKNNRVYGGFAGNEGPDFNLADRDFEANPTVLDGQNQRRVLYQTDHFQNHEYALWDGFTIKNGNAGAGAGAYLCCNSRFENCKFLNNNSIGFGGGAYVITAYYDNATVQFTKCTFEGNHGSLGGGLCDMMGAHLLNCRFSNNDALTKGGAYYVFANKQSNIVNTIFDHNTAKFGGAMYNKGKISMINCDIVDNHTLESGGGLVNETQYSKIYNSVFWGNTAAGEPNQIDGTSKFFYCAIQGGFNGTNIIDLSQANDGTDNVNYPRFVNPDEGDYTIERNSVCVDAGDNSVSGITGPDLLGNQRIVNNIIDLGAIECQNGLSVADIDEASFELYPNPFDNQLVVKMDGLMYVEIFNCLGQKITAVEAHDELTLDTAEWDNGVYFVRINGLTKKVVK